MASNNFKLNCGYVNIQSVKNKATEIRELINDNFFDVFALTETWLSESDLSCIEEMTPSTHVFLHVPRVGRRGGGVGIFVHRSFKQLKMENSVLAASFEHMKVSFSNGGKRMCFVVVYRPPSENNLDVFFNEFEFLLESVQALNCETYICGDFNIWMDDMSRRDVSIFNDLLSVHQLVNKVTVNTSIAGRAGHMLDLVICNEDSPSLFGLCVEEKCSISPVHKLVTFALTASTRNNINKEICFRVKSRFDPESYINCLAQKFSSSGPDTCVHNETSCIDCLLEEYNQIAKEEYDRACPLVKKTIALKDHSPWFNSIAVQIKRQKRSLEKKWRRLKTKNLWNEYKAAKNQYNNVIKKCKIEYYNSKINEFNKNPVSLHKLLKCLTGNIKKHILPDEKPNKIIADDFSLYLKKS